MNVITSGTSTERIIRSLLFSLLIDFFAIYFLYDGYVGYPLNNMRQLASLLGLSASEAPAPNPEMTQSRGEKLAASLRAGDPVDKLITDLGTPPIRQEGALYYPGPGGWLHVGVNRDRIEKAQWSKGPHSEADQQIQQWIGWGLVLVGFAATLNLARVIGTRAVLTQDSLKVTGRPPVSIASMTALRSVNASGTIHDLEYEAESFRKTLRLDPYIYKESKAITREIAAKKGFPLPPSV